MKSLILSVLTLILITLTLAPTQLLADTPAGYFPVGTDFRYNNRNVYFVNTAAEFQQISNDSTGIYLIMNDIDMNGRHIEGLSTFNGAIHGFGHSIENMRYDGDNLIAASNRGHIEWINFSNVTIDTPNTSPSTGFLFGTNYGDIENITYSITNTTGTSMIPPMINSNNGFVDSVIGNYDIEASVESNFTLYTALSDTSDRVNDYWIRGNVDVSADGIFYYRSMGSPNRSQNCVDALNVNVVTASSINSSYGSRCYYSSAESALTYDGEDVSVGFDGFGILDDNEEIVDRLDSNFNTDYWSIQTTDITLDETSRYNLAGEHQIRVNLDNGFSETLNLYQAPYFNSEQLDYSRFAPNYNGPIEEFSTEVSYATNYSRVLINDESAKRSQTIEQFEDITIRLESDYNLPSLEFKLRIYPELNFTDGSRLPLGTIPTTSLGYITSNESFDREGKKELSLNFGQETLNFDVTIVPLISGVSENGQYDSPVTPIITAASVEINGESYNDAEAFTQVGRYDVVFPNLTSENFSFYVNPEYEFNTVSSQTVAETFELSNNFSNLTINGITYDESFIQSQSSILLSTGSMIKLNLDYGRHRIELSGINGFKDVITRDNPAEYSVDIDESTHEINVQVTGAELFIDESYITSGAMRLEDLGYYDMDIKYPSENFSLDAGFTVTKETLTIDPVFENLINGETYEGTATPDVYMQAGTMQLNNENIDLDALNQTYDVPGRYEVRFNGKNGYRYTFVFSVRVISNIDQDIYYDAVDIEFSSPNNLIEYQSPDALYDEEILDFDYTESVRTPGRYTVSTMYENGDKVQIDRFDILPMERMIEGRNDELRINLLNLHPDVQIRINNETFTNPNQGFRYTAAGRYDVSFESTVDDVIFEDQSHVVFPQFDRDILEESNRVEQYEITNEFVEFYINERLIENEVFLETQTFNVNQNGDNIIRIVGINNEVFTYESFFNNPHFNNVTRLSWYAIGTGLIGISSIVGRYLLAVRRDS